MTETANRKEFQLDYLLHPGKVFQNPVDVVTAPDITAQEKRAILASWASDACDVDDTPDSRYPPTVRFDDVMDALKQLDGEAANKPQYAKLIDRARRWKGLWRSDESRRVCSREGDQGDRRDAYPSPSAHGRFGW